MSWQADLRALLERVPADDLPDLAGELGRAQAICQLRLQEANGGAPPEEERRRAAPDPPDRLLDVNEAAEVLGVDTRWLYRRADRLPFSRKLGPRTLRFSEAGIRRWLETRR